MFASLLFQQSWAAGSGGDSYAPEGGYFCSSDALRLSITVMFVMVLNPEDNSLEEIEVEPYDRFSTEEKARIFMYAHACFSLWNIER
jgi:hypothetical protein